MSSAGTSVPTMPRTRSQNHHETASVRRRVPSQDRSIATVGAILDATAQVLADVGVERASTNKIAQRAGMGVGSIYQYFPNKEAVIEALVDDRMGRLETFVSTELSDFDSSSVSDAAEPMIRSVSDFLAKEPGLRPLLMTRFFTASGKSLERIRSEALVLGRSLVDQSRGLSDRDRDVAALILTHTVGLFGALFADPSLDAEVREVAIGEVARMLAAWMAGENAPSHVPG